MTLEMSQQEYLSVGVHCTSVTPQRPLGEKYTCSSFPTEEIDLFVNLPVFLSFAGEISLCEDAPG